MALIQALSPTTTTSVSTAFNPTFTDRVVRALAMEPMLGQEIAEPIDLTQTGVNSYTYRSLAMDEMSGAAVVPQNDAAPEAAASVSNIDIDGSRIALRNFLLDQAEISLVPLAQSILERLVRAVRRAYHALIMAQFSNFSNVQGSNSTENTLGNWDLVTHNFRMQNHAPGQLWASLSNGAMRDLRADLITTAAALFGATFGDRAAAALHNQTPGLSVPFDGFNTYVTNDTPFGDTTGRVSAIGVKGAIGMPIWQGLKAAYQRDESRFGEWIIVSMIAGVGILNQYNARAFITRA
jgi:hypothetical protein